MSISVIHRDGGLFIYDVTCTWKNSSVVYREGNQCRRHQSIMTNFYPVNVYTGTCNFKFVAFIFWPVFLSVWISICLSYKLELLSLLLLKHIPSSFGTEIVDIWKFINFSVLFAAGLYLVFPIHTNTHTNTDTCTDILCTAHSYFRPMDV